MFIRDKSTEYFNNSGLLTDIAAVLFFMFILLKPYYLKPSGSVGIADICLAGAGMFLMFREFIGFCKCRNSLSIDENVNSNYRMLMFQRGYGKRNTEASGVIYGNGVLYRDDICMYLFIIAALIINAVHEHLYPQGNFSMYSSFWVYNCLAVWTCRKLSGCELVPKNGMNKSAVSVKKIVIRLLEFDIIMQLIILISGHGRIFTEYWGAIRYMGSFNDPNQLAFFMLMSILLVFELSADPDVYDAAKTCSSKKNVVISYIKAYLPEFITVTIALFIIIMSKSTGIMLGVAVFVFLLWLCSLRELTVKKIVSGRTVLIFAAVVGMIGALLLWYIWPSADFNVQELEYNTLTRIQEKLWKLSQGGAGGFLLDRGADKIAAFPQYMLFGAGEGAFERFQLPGREINELHCSLLSILFCYGVVPTLLMLTWCVKCLRNKNRWQLCALIALIAESFTLINYRQPMFWFLFVL